MPFSCSRPQQGILQIIGREDAWVGEVEGEVGEDDGVIETFTLEE